MAIKKIVFMRSEVFGYEEFGEDADIERLADCAMRQQKEDGIEREVGYVLRESEDDEENEA